MNENFVPVFRFHDLVDVLDETAGPTGMQARVVGACVDKQGERTGFYNVALCKPQIGCRNIAAGQLRLVRSKPAHLMAVR